MASLPYQPIAHVAIEEAAWYDSHPGCRWHLTHGGDEVSVLRMLIVLSPSRTQLASFVLSDMALHDWAPVAAWFELLLHASSESTFTEIAQAPARGVDLVGFSARGAA